MIPKIIHFCWLSTDEYPPLIKKCMDTWKEKLPDYEFIHWDTERFNLEGNTWVRQAFESKKYAFAADYIRLHAVYNYGGIYLDTDIEVIKSFNDLLERPYFIGSEGQGVIEAGVFGAEKNMDWVGKCLEHYEDREFIKKDNTFDTLTLPRIMMSQINLIRAFEEVLPSEISTVNQIEETDNIYMFPNDFFCAKNHGTGVITKTENTYSVHHFAMSWLPKKRTFLPNLKRKLMTVFGVNTVNKLIKVLGLRKLKSNG